MGGMPNYRPIGMKFGMGGVCHVKIVQRKIDRIATIDHCSGKVFAFTVKNIYTCGVKNPRTEGKFGLGVVFKEKTNSAKCRSDRVTFSGIFGCHRVFS